MEGRAVPKQRIEPVLHSARARQRSYTRRTRTGVETPKATPNPKLGGWDGNFVRQAITPGLCSLTSLEPEWPQGMDTPQRLETCAYDQRVLDVHYKSSGSHNLRMNEFIGKSLSARFGWSRESNE